jgi:molybdate transport repressor ModE-like protein
VELSGHVPDLAGLSLLLDVARAGSLNAAARKAGVSQQAVSSRIQAMEAQTGVVLVHRSPRGSTLTAEGAVIAEWAGRLLEVAAGLDSEIAALRTGRRRQLRVSASYTIAEQLLPGWLASFRARDSNAPAVVLTATSSEQAAIDVTGGRADIGFTEGPRPPSGLRSLVIGHDRLAVVVAPGHPWARRRNISPAELAATPLASREIGSGIRNMLAAALTAALGTQTPLTGPALSLSTTATVRAAALAGIAPSVISELAIADDLAAGHLIQIDVPGLELRRTLRVIWDGSAAPPAGAARDLIAHILSDRASRSWSGTQPRSDAGAQPARGHQPDAAPPSRPPATPGMADS